MDDNQKLSIPVVAQQEAEDTSKYIVVLSDAPVVDEAPKEDEESEIDEAPKTEKPADDTSAETDAPKPSRLQKRIDRITREKHDLERENEELRKKVVGTSKPGDATNAEPGETSFEDYDEYLIARDAWRDDQSKDTQTAVQDKNPVDKSFQGAKQDIRDSYDDVRAKYKDFDAVVEAPDLPLTKSMIMAIAECDEQPGDIVYYLGMHKDEAKKIALLPSPLAQAKAIGKIEAKLSMIVHEPAKKTTNAPPPINPLNGTGDRPKDYSTMSQAEYEAARDAEQARSAGGGWL